MKNFPAKNLEKTNYETYNSGPYHSSTSPVPESDGLEMKKSALICHECLAKTIDNLL